MRGTKNLPDKGVNNKIEQSCVSLLVMICQHIVVLYLTLNFAQKITANVCNPNPCQNSGACSRIFSNKEYFCTCPNGFVGRNCDQALILNSGEYGCYDATALPTSDCINMGGTNSPTNCREQRIRNFIPTNNVPEVFVVRDGVMCCWGTKAAWTVKPAGRAHCNTMCTPEPAVSCGGTKTEEIVVNPLTGETRTEITNYAMVHTIYYEIPNQCATKSCQNGAVCVQYRAYGECLCALGYEGDSCQTDIDECASNPCKHSGTCSNKIGKFKCKCNTAAGWGGTTCQDVDTCRANYFPFVVRHHKCVNGDCVDGIITYSCKCHAGWTGEYCDIDIEECLSNPCQYNSHCNDTIKIDHYLCTCVDGTTGSNCEINIDECGSSPCDGVDKVAICNDEVNGFNCTCSPAYTDKLCDMDINVWKIREKFKGTMDLSAVEDILRQSSTIVDSVPFLVGQLNRTVQESLSWNHVDMFRHCEYEDKLCKDNYGDIIKWFEPTMGNCFTFNHKSIYEDVNYYTKRAGRGNGLTLVLVAVQEEYVPWTEVAGVRVFIHNQSDTIYAESVGYAVPPGFISTIALDYTVYKRMESPYGDCVHNKKEMKYFYYPGAYSTEGCFRSCYQNEVFKECGCMDPRYPSDPEKNTCPLEQRKCVNDFGEQKGNPNDWDCSDVRNCPLPCLSGEYAVSLSRTRFPDESQSCDYLADGLNGGKIGATKDELKEQDECRDYYGYMNKNYMHVELFFEQMAYVMYEETPRYPPNKLLSDVGGQLGILCGMSVISMTEIVFALSMIIFTYITGYYG